MGLNRNKNVIKNKFKYLEDVNVKMHANLFVPQCSNSTFFKEVKVNNTTTGEYTSCITFCGYFCCHCVPPIIIYLNFFADEHLLIVS